MSDRLSIKLSCPEVIKPKAEYVIKLISLLTGYRFIETDEAADIGYGIESGIPLTIPCDPPSYEPVNINNCRWLRHNEIDLLLPPGIVPGRLPEYDLFGLIYSMIISSLKSHNSYNESLTGDVGYVRPFLKNLVRHFFENIKNKSALHPSSSIRSPWAAKAPFAIGLSHDIDILNRSVSGSIRMAALSVIGHRSMKGASGTLKGLLDSGVASVTGKPNPYHCFSKWLEVDSGKGTFFVFDGKRTDKRDPVYTPVQLQAVLKTLDLKLPSVAIHNSINSWEGRQYLHDIKFRFGELFKSAIKGIRPHYLSCSFPEFWQNISGYEYSSTTGSDMYLGFVSGLDIPFYGFDFETGEEIDVLEIPITVMDCALMETVPAAKRGYLIDNMIDECVENHSLLVLDWHNRTAYEPEFPGWLETYIMILDKAKSRGAQIDSLDNINSYWRAYCASLL